MGKLFYLIVIFSITACIGCSKNHNRTQCACIKITPAQDSYIYPVQPGTAKWDSAGRAGGNDSLYILCQVPDYLLKSMSTFGLIQTLEINPMLFNMFLRDNKFQGRDEVLSRLNVSWSLNKRIDAATEIMNYYKERSPCCVDTITNDIEKGKFAND